MAPVTPAIEPTVATAGATWTWTLQDPNYPISEGWALSYAINGAGTLTWSGSWVTDDGATFTVAVPAASTAGLPAGRYEVTRIWAGSGTYSGRVDLVGLPSLVVEANPTTAQPGDRIAFAESNLEAVECAIAARLKGDQPEEYSIGGRSVVKMKLIDLYRVRRSLQDELWKLRHPGQTRQRVIRFVAASP